MKRMREYSDSVKRNFILMMNSPDWGRRFYDEHARPFFYSMINNMVETSEYSLDKLTIKEDNSTRWLAYFHHDPKTDEKFFAFNKEKILDGKSTALNGSLISNDVILPVSLALQVPTIALCKIASLEALTKFSS